MMILNVAWLLRLRAVSLGSQSEVTFREDTGLLKLTLGQDEVSPLPPPSLLSLFFPFVLHLPLISPFVLSLKASMHSA